MTTRAGSIGIDNTDIRFADVANIDGHNVIYGLSLNNNPTVQDLWNSTPAWGQPFIGSPAAQAPPFRARRSKARWPRSSRAVRYTYIDNSLYVEAGVYRSALQGAVGRRQRQHDQQHHLRRRALLARGL
jgi:hypothetical protein